MTDLLTLDQLAAAADIPRKPARAWLPHINAACGKYAINTPLRLAAFLAQVSHESGSFRYVREIWGPTLAQQRYEGRKDLGNTQPGDGSRYRGRGLIQMTGRRNYERVQEALGVPCVADPGLLERYEWAALSAAWFWRRGTSEDLNTLADARLFTYITRRINGGLNGQEDRQRLYAGALKALGVTA